MRTFAYLLSKETTFLEQSQTLEKIKNCVLQWALNGYISSFSQGKRDVKVDKVVFKLFEELDVSKY